MTKLGEAALVTGKLRSELAHSLPLEAWAQDKELVSFEPLMGELRRGCESHGQGSSEFVPDSYSPVLTYDSMALESRDLDSGLSSGAGSHGATGSLQLYFSTSPFVKQGQQLSK